MYHLTTEDFGKYVTLFPRDHGINRSHAESKINRICVAPTILHCLSAVYFEKIPNIYWSPDTNFIDADDTIKDREATLEKWYINKTVFIKVNLFLDYEMYMFYKHETSGINVGCPSGIVGQIEFINKAQKRFINHLNVIEIQRQKDYDNYLKEVNYENLSNYININS